MSTFLTVNIIGIIITALWLTRYDFVPGISLYTKVTRTALALLLWPVALIILILDTVAE